MASFSTILILVGVFLIIFGFIKYRINENRHLKTQLHKGGGIIKNPFSIIHSHFYYKRQHYSIGNVGRGGIGLLIMYGGIAIVILSVILL